MNFKLVLFSAFFAYTNAGGITVPSHFSYGVHSPLAYSAHPAPAAHFAYAAPAAHFAYAAPAIAKVAAPLAYAAPAASLAYAAPAAPLAYASPAFAKVPAPVMAPAIAKVATPVLTKAVVAEEYDPNPQYSYAYNIHDGITGDNKNQYETRNGDYVQGSYSLNDSDGTRRIVEYTADPIHGFNAVVHKEPLVAKVAAAPLAVAAAPLAVPAAPIAKVAAPLPYAAITKYY